MTFLAPLFLLGALAVAIPIIIHFLNLRKPNKVSFSTLAFFRELQKSTIKRLKIKRLLLLAVRIALIIMLAMALARPFLPPGWSDSTDRTPVLYGFIVDNGIGMDRIDADGPYLDRVKDLVGEIISNALPSDRFVIMNTHGEHIRTGVLSAEKAVSTLQSLEISRTGNQSGSRISEMLSTLKTWSDGPKVLYRVTTSDGVARDFAKFNPYDTELDGVVVNYVTLGRAATSNTVVTGLSLPGTVSGPGRPLQLEVTLSNLGNQAVFNQFVSLEVQGNPSGQHQINLEPGDSRSVLFEMIPPTSGSITGRILLEGDQFQPDNIHYFSILVPETRNVLLISDADGAEGSYVRAVLGAAEQIQGRIRVQQANSNNYSSLGSPEAFDVVILSAVPRPGDDIQEALVRAVQSGTGLVIFPSERADVTLYNRFFSRLNIGQINGFRGDYGSFEPVARVDRIRDGHPIIDEIFIRQENEDVRITLPSVFYNLIFDTSTRSPGLTVLQSELGDPLLIDHRFGNGRVLISAIGADPGWSSFPGNALFAPVFYRTILHAMSTDRGGLLRHTLGTTFDREFNMRGERIVMTGDQSDYLPAISSTVSGGTRLEYPAVEWEPGIYRIRSESAEFSIASNFDISESDFYTLSDENTFELLSLNIEQFQVFGLNEDSYEQTLNSLSASGFGSEIWYWFIILAIMLLIIELAISRWYKAETIT